MQPRLPSNGPFTASGALFIALIIGNAQPVPAAAENIGHCVSCTGPAATYLCEVRGLSPDAQAGMKGQLLCISRLARDLGHQACAVERRPATACEGRLQVVEAEGPAHTGAAVAGEGGMVTPPSPAEPNALARAGNAVATASRKSWTCLSSLFKDC